MSSDSRSSRPGASARPPASGRPAWRPFFATYGRDLLFGDLSGAAARWRWPSVLLSAFGVASFRRPAEIERHLAGVWLRYRQAGVSGLKPVLIDARPLEADLFAVEVEWALLDRRGEVRGREFSRQIVRRQRDGQLGIELMLTVHAHCLAAGPIGLPEG